jgi:ADP-ribose pyrophosphatase YjhB (NUDIX family)
MPSYYRDPSAPAPNQPRRVGVVAVIEREGAVLFEQRADFGTWGLIGGLLDEDETVEDGIAREIREETGLEAVSIELFGVFSDPSRIIAYPDGNVIRLLSVAFLVTVADGEPRVSEESLELRFVDVGAIAGLDLSPAQRPVIDAYLAGRRPPVVA